MDSIVRARGQMLLYEKDALRDTKGTRDER